MVGVRGARRARNGMDLTRHILARADRPADQEAGRRSKQQQQSTYTTHRRFRPPQLLPPRFQRRPGPRQRWQKTATTRHRSSPAHR